jgi:hypothetical protein
MSELQQIKVLSFNSLIVIASLSLEYEKKNSKTLVGAPIKFEITQNTLKMRKIWSCN